MGTDNGIVSKGAIEIRIANVSLGAKLNAIGAALEAVREAHREVMPQQCWAAINRAEREIAEATLTASSGNRYLKFQNDLAKPLGQALTAYREEYGEEALKDFLRGFLNCTLY